MESALIPLSELKVALADMVALCKCRDTSHSVAALPTYSKSINIDVISIFKVYSCTTYNNQPAYYGKTAPMTLACPKFRSSQEGCRMVRLWAQIYSPSSAWNYRVDWGK